MLFLKAQNHREISFKKGDLIYIKRQVDSNWYEGERNAMIGIFPTTYVEIIPGADPNSTPLGTLKSIKSGTGSAVGTINTYIQEGQGKAKFSFQVFASRSFKDDFLHAHFEDPIIRYFK